MADSPDSYDTVLDAAIALYRNEIDEDAFVDAVVALPVVIQHPIPEAIRHGLDDAWLPKSGPIRQLQTMLSAGLIGARTFDKALEAMIHAGHSA